MFGHKSMLFNSNMLYLAMNYHQSNWGAFSLDYTQSVVSTNTSYYISYGSVIGKANQIISNQAFSYFAIVGALPDTNNSNSYGIISIFDSSFTNFYHR